MELTNTPNDVKREIESMMNDELNGGKLTGFRPYLKDGKIHFEHRWILFIGKKVKSEKHVR
jgi:hypothetical protein